MEQYSELYIQPGEDCAAVLQSLCAWKWTVEQYSQVCRSQEKTVENLKKCGGGRARMRSCTCTHVCARMGAHVHVRPRARANPDSKLCTRQERTVEQYSELYIQPGEDCAAVLQALCTWKWTVKQYSQVCRSQERTVENPQKCGGGRARMRSCTCTHVCARMCMHANEPSSTPS